MSQEKICFVIAPIGKPGTELRRRSDQMQKYVFGPVAGEKCGYLVLRADELPDPGLITSQIIHHLTQDSLVIADLTGWNPNVFYELAIRHATRKPVVQIIQRGEKIPFDVAQFRTIEVDHHDLESVETCKLTLEKHIRAVEKDPSLADNPVAFTIDLQASRHSVNPVERNNAEIIELLLLLSSQIRVLAELVTPKSSHQKWMDEYLPLPEDDPEFQALSKEAKKADLLSLMREAKRMHELLREALAEKKNAGAEITG